MAKGGKKKSARSDTELVAYRGAISRGIGRGAPQTVRVPLIYRFNLAGSGAGYIELITNTSQASASPEWSNYAGLWKEYRILGIKAEYLPWYNSTGYPGSAQKMSVGAIAPFHGASPSFQGAVSTSTDLAVWQYDGSKAFHPAEKVTVEWRMNDVEEAQYFNTSSTPGILGGIYGVVPSVTASTVYGTVLVTFLVEYKGRI